MQCTGIEVDIQFFFLLLECRPGVASGLGEGEGEHRCVDRLRN